MEKEKNMNPRYIYVYIFLCYFIVLIFFNTQQVERGKNWILKIHEMLLMEFLCFTRDFFCSFLLRFLFFTWKLERNSMTSVFSSFHSLRLVVVLCQMAFHLTSDWWWWWIHKTLKSLSQMSLSVFRLLPFFMSTNLMHGY